MSQPIQLISIKFFSAGQLFSNIVGIRFLFFQVLKFLFRLNDAMIFFKRSNDGFYLSEKKNVNVWEVGIKIRFFFHSLINFIENYRNIKFSYFYLFLYSVLKIY